MANPAVSGIALALRQNLGTEIEGCARQQVRADREIDELVETLFRDTEKGMDAYLDWYFSLIGQYTRLAAWMKSLP
jgi:hypothetical protein